MDGNSTYGQGGLKQIGDAGLQFVYGIGLRKIDRHLREGRLALTNEDIEALGQHLKSAVGVYNRLVAENAIPSNPAPESEREVA